MFSPVSAYHWIKSVGRSEKARLSQWAAVARRIIKESDSMRQLSSEQLLSGSRDIQWQAKTGTPLKSLLIEAFSLVRESARRVRGMPHYPVQLIGGIAMLNSQVAEMQTGEGKTMTAVLTAYLRALVGRGCHVVTVNDYLARRDAEWMGPIYQSLGISVDCIQAEMEPDERRTAYDSDITYSTAKELGFNFLRDRLRKGTSFRSNSRRSHPLVVGDDPPVVRRGHYFSLIDEADRVLIDDARTPLVIGLKQPNSASAISLLQWCDRASRRLEYPTDYGYEPDRRLAVLTEEGCRKIMLMEKSRLLNSARTEEFYVNIERALAAHLGFQRDRDYVVKDEEVVIVDESTGRVLDGRKWQEGLHQAIEAKEMLPLTADTSSAARITVQRFFRQYAHVGGMTGTAVSAAGEFRLACNLQVTPIPTHRKCVRIGLPTRIFSTAEAKRAAIVVDVEQIYREGRPVLIGTPSVEASEKLKSLFEQQQIPHKILSARFHEEEAEIIAEAGQPGRVTIATNMAGRGTDIVLHEGIAERGGLHVIATELHSSERIDRQLAGRAARQGDPGSFQLFLSLDDELLRCRTQEQLASLRKRRRPMVAANYHMTGYGSSATHSGFWKRPTANNARTCCAARRHTWNRCGVWGSIRTSN
jgi:preprotein translocase subunit SecA